MNRALGVLGLCLLGCVDDSTGVLALTEDFLWYRERVYTAFVHDGIFKVFII